MNTVFVVGTFAAGSVFAQAVADPISGGGGWLGAGLLGAVLSWLLLVHLPAKDKLVREMQGEHQATVRSITTEFTTELKAERAACEASDLRLIASMRESQEAFTRGLELIGKRAGT